MREVADQTLGARGSGVATASRAAPVRLQARRHQAFDAPRGGAVRELLADDSAALLELRPPLTLTLRLRPFELSPKRLVLRERDGLQIGILGHGHEHGARSAIL